MGLEAPAESHSALANPPDDDQDCEWIHKGVTTRPVRILAVPASGNVDQQPNAAVFPPRHSSTLLEPTEPHKRLTDWSL
jgi:hypothetical protein